MPKQAPKPKKLPIIEKLEQMEQTDGKDYALSAQIEVSKKKTLNEIWGRKYSLFKTNDPQEYLAKLRLMTKLDLQQECIRIGLMPHDSRETMIQRLFKQCSMTVAAARTSCLQPKTIRVGRKSKAILQRSSMSLT